MRIRLLTPKTPDWRLRRPVELVVVRRLSAAAAIIGLGLLASGCAQSMGELAGGGMAATTRPASLTADGTATTQPAVLTEEMTVPMRSAHAPPMRIEPPAPQVTSLEQDQSIAPAAVNLNRVPDQPSGKLLTPTEKAKVIAELEALAKKQSAALDKDSKSAACAADKLDPAKRVASATGDGGC